MIYNTVMTEGSSIEILSRVFEKLNRQVNENAFSEHPEAFVFYPEGESLFFYSRPKKGQILNLQIGKDSGEYALNEVKPNVGCIAAVLLPKPYRLEDFEQLVVDTFRKEDAEERVYRIVRGDSVHCNAERIGLIGFPEKGIIKFSYAGSKALRGDSIKSIKRLVELFLDNAEMEDGV